jgi:hypothetical protein
MVAQHSEMPNSAARSRHAGPEAHRPEQTSTSSLL